MHPRPTPELHHTRLFGIKYAQHTGRMRSPLHKGGRSTRISVGQLGLWLGPSNRDPLPGCPRTTPDEGVYFFYNAASLNRR